MTQDYYCQVCRDYESNGFYDVRAHVYTSHAEQTCGIAELHPDVWVGTRE